MAFCADCGARKQMCSCATKSRSREPRESEQRDQDCKAGHDAKILGVVEEAGGLKALLDKATERNRKHIQEENRALMREFLQTAKDGAKKLVEQMGRDLRVEMKTGMDNLRAEVVNSASSSGNASGTKLTGRKPVGEYKAEKIWVKGFIVDWKAKEQTSLSKPQVKEWLDKTYEEMEDSIKEHMDMEATAKFANRVLFTKIGISLKNVTDREIAWSVKGDIKRIWQQGKCLINGVVPRVTVPPSPDMAPYVDAGGKMLGALREKGVARQALKPEWGPPLLIFDVRNPERLEKIAEYESTKGWDVQESALQSIAPEVSKAELMASIGK